MKTVHKIISEFTEVITGGTPSTHKAEYWDGNIPWLNSGILNDGDINKPSRYITELGLKNSAAKLMPPNTVLIALTGATTGQVGYLKIEASANQSVTGILPSKLHHPRYLYYYLQTQKKKIQGDAFGGGQPHINQQYVKDIKIPLPPLDDQIRIATILARAEKLIAKRKESIKLLDELLKSTFLEMFGDPVRNEMGWERIPLSEILEKIESGRSPVCLDRPAKTGEWGVLKLSAVTQCEFNPNEKARNSTGIAPICFVGLNGSGKSNVLEVIAEIFYYLETYHKAPKGKLKAFKTSFGFEIDYELPRVYVMSTRNSWNELNHILSEVISNPIIKITKQANQYPETTVLINDRYLALKNNDNNRNDGLLPARIVAYSSGMNELLSNPFIKIDFQYYDELKANSGIESLVMNRMFFLNYDSNKFIAISNFLFDADDYDMSSFTKDRKATEFGGIDLSAIKRELCIKDLHSFVINLKLKKSSPLHSTLYIALDNLKKCATFVNESVRETKNDTLRDVELVYWVNKSTKEAFRYYFRTAYDLFKIFYFFQLLNNQLVSQDIRKSVAAAQAGSYENLSDELPKPEASNLIFRISGITFSKGNNSRLHYRKLSDGEHQLLQVIGSLLLMDTNGSLFLMDEPETHFNPDWRSKFVSIANESIDKERDQEIILTTHSPYIVSDCLRDNVYIFRRQANGSVSRPESPEINTFGTSVNILEDAVFGKEDTISELSKKKINEIRKMPLESLEDIQAAKEASRVLGESIEKVLLFKYLITIERELKNDKGI